MAAHTLPDLELLRQLFTYCPKTGVLTYLPRDSSLFSDEHHWKIWTSRFCNKPAGRLDGDGYLCVLIFGRVYRAHRIIYKMTHGTDPRGVIDHVNGNKTDNRIDNLRPATHQQNLWNRGPQKNSRLGMKGVSVTKWGRYSAHIKINGKSTNLGHFQTPEDAAEAYRNAAAQHFGDFAWKG